MTTIEALFVPVNRRDDFQLTSPDGLYKIDPVECEGGYFLPVEILANEKYYFALKKLLTLERKQVELKKFQIVCKP